VNLRFFVILRNCVVGCFVFAAIGSSVRLAEARYMRPDLVDTPIDRLATNLVKLAEENPKDAQVLFNLARLHAMAFALKTDTAKTWRSREKQGAWFGYEPKYVPFENTPTDDAEKLQTAKTHLEKAISYYDEAIKLKPDFLAARLGHAWCIEQSGAKDKAIELYRKLVVDAWKTEGKLTRGGRGGHYITAEAAEYLISLLDAAEDAAEIKTMQERAAYLKALPRPITPIAIPLTDDLSPTGLLGCDTTVRFDADGTGQRSAWTWIHKDAGWLVYDPHGRGEISSALQMFGNVSFWLFWDNGYQALTALDDNADRVLRGSELAGLAIWCDANSNGISEPGEVTALESWGIVGLSCEHCEHPSHPDRIPYSPQGVLFRDGTTRPSYDVILRKAAD